MNESLRSWADHQGTTNIPPNQNMVSLSPTTQKRHVGMDMNESVGFWADASRNNQQKCYHQSLLPTKKKKGMWAHI